MMKDDIRDSFLFSAKLIKDSVNLTDKIEKATKTVINAIKKVHRIIYHIICEIVEKELVGSSRNK